MLRKHFRRLAPLLVGMIAALTGLLVADLARARLCVDRGAAWDAVARSCTSAAGAVTLGARPALLGFVAAAVVAWVLSRVVSFVAMRAARGGAAAGGAGAGPADAGTPR